MRILFVLLVMLLAWPAAAQSPASPATLDQQLGEAQRAARFYWTQADSLNRTLQLQRTANEQLRQVLYNEIDINHQLLPELEHLRRIVRRHHLQPYYYTRPQ